MNKTIMCFFGCAKKRDNYKKGLTDIACLSQTETRKDDTFLFEAIKASIYDKKKKRMLCCGVWCVHSALAFAFNLDQSEVAANWFTSLREGSLLNSQAEKGAHWVLKTLQKGAK